MTIENLLSLLNQVRQTGPDRWRARCPGPGHARGDRHPSLNLRELADGRVLLHCPVCQDTPAILAAVGLTLSDLYPPRPATETCIKPERRPFPAADIFKSLAFEATIVLCAAADMLNAGDLVLGQDGFDRLALAHDRIQSALSLAEGGYRHG